MLEKAMDKIHLEHLLAFYSGELLIRAHAATHPGGFPISDVELETFYRHFEAAIILASNFKKCTKNDAIFIRSAVHWRPPSIGQPSANSLA